VQENPGPVTWRSHQTTECLVHLDHAGDLINPLEGLVAGKSDAMSFRQTRVLYGIHFRQRRSYDHRMPDAAAECVNALREARTEHEKERVTGAERRVDPG